MSEHEVAANMLQHPFPDEREKFRAIFDRTFEMVGLMDVDGLLLEINQSFARFLGQPAEELLGRELGEIVARRSPSAHMPELVRLAIEQASSGQFFRYELEVAGPDDELLLLDFSITPVTNAREEVNLLIAEARDVTDRHRSAEASQQASKLESLGLMAGGVAQDFNNILVALQGQTGLALVKMAEDHPARPHVEKAQTAAQRAAELTRQLLAYAGQTTLSIQPLNLCRLIEDNMPLLSVVIPRNIALATDLERDTPPFPGDAAQVQQVVMNLILNAAEAIGGQPGKITLGVRERHITLSDETFWQFTNYPLFPGQYVALTVADDGSGMDNETLQRIFDPFFTTKPEGRGLGLSVVLGLVRTHRGGLRVQSRVNEGTTIEIVFPVQLSTGVGAAPPVADSRPRAAPVVLLVDDDAIVRETAYDILSSAGLAVLTAVDGDDGLTTLQVHRGAVALIVLDFSMPGRSSASTFRAMRDQAPNVPVILSSGFSEQEAMSHFEGLDPDGFVQKPYTPGRLLAAIQLVLNRS